MPKVVLASALTRWLDAAAAGRGEIALDAPGDTLADSLDTVFARHPKLRGYVLDEHGGVRHHVAIFVDGSAMRDKRDLRIPVGKSTEIYILQALSGG
jgi:hypothetical protein